MTRLLFASFVLFVPILVSIAHAQTTPIRAAATTAPIVEPAAPARGPAPPQSTIAPIPMQPDWVATMTPQAQKWTDDVLHYWESSSEKIKLFECKFRRWDYDGGFVTDGKWQPRTYAEGSIKYAQPDKGLYHVEKLILNQPGAAGQPPQQIVQNPELGEHWICNGEKIYSFEANKKQVTVTALPPDMRGKAIADGPLPFLFGAKAETIKARYWIRGLPGAQAGKYWLEAVPKSRDDAQNFKQVRIIMDQEKFLPESLEVFAPNYNPPQNDARQTYQFVDRNAKNDADIKDLIAKKVLDPFGLIHRDFFNVQPPFGWKMVEQNGGGNIPAGPPQQAGPPSPQSQPKTR